MSNVQITKYEIIMEAEEILLKYLGNPDRVEHYDGPNQNGNVKYIYKNECIEFIWNDSGIEPKIFDSWIEVTCDKWATANGFFIVGMPIKSVFSRPGEYCASNFADFLEVSGKEGIWFQAKNRNSTVSSISISSSFNKWLATTNCKD